VSGYDLSAETIDGIELVSVTLSGPASLDGIIGLLRELEARRPSRVLIDESGLRAGFVSPGQIRQIADEWRKAAAVRAARIAVFTPNLVIYGLNRMFQGWADAGDRVAVFTDRAAATAWLLERGSETSPQ